ncbi:CaiB/BaiF CoA transferase family protein [Dietzia psychralcaliphila]|uniref:CaiB/BaiF CoA transferase family protein n=1 Tax=Dietzia psychralcaliphila TaxID=139021 RepID=UPI001C1E6B03|nr:CoA transferase [Dietzia psychralcaliphila]
MTTPPLDGIRVVELAQMVAGPGTGLLLADYGAEVIKIEPPGGEGARQLKSPTVLDIDPSPVFSAYNRNKSLVTADLRDETDRAEVLRLCKDADVVLTSSRPGVMERLGLGYRDLKTINPMVVYAAVTGFGDGPLGQSRGGVDLLVQAESGLMSTTGELGGQPLKVGFTVVDAATAHALTHGILAALLRRARTGVGEYVAISLYDVAVQLQTGPIAEFLHSSEQTPRLGNSAPFSAPADLFRCSDMDIVLSAYLPHHWLALLECLGLPELAGDERFATGSARSRNRQELSGLLAEVFATRTASQWLTELSGRGILAAPVQDHAAVVASPLTEERQLLVDTDDLKAVTTPVTMSELPTPRHAETLGSVRDVRWEGEHNE